MESRATSLTRSPRRLVRVNGYQYHCMHTAMLRGFQVAVYHPLHRALELNGPVVYCSRPFVDPGWTAGRELQGQYRCGVYMGMGSQLRRGDPLRREWTGQRPYTARRRMRWEWRSRDLIYPSIQSLALLGDAMHLVSTTFPIHRGSPSVLVQHECGEDAGMLDELGYKLIAKAWPSETVACRRQG